MEKVIKERSQFHPILAQGGEQGWEILNNQFEATETPPTHITAVILDLFMPGVNGFTILERLRTTSSQALHALPVIVVSGVDLTQDQKQQLDHLGKHMLQKGMLDEKELFSTLEKALKRLERN
jgi:CheY-like chemotaxis protein